MFRHLTAWIDALGDRIHPIAVLQLRRQKLGRGWLPVTLGTHVILLLIVWLGAERLAYNFGPVITHFGEMYLHLPLWFLFIASCAAGINGYRFVQKSDPLLLATGLSDRSVWLGFYQTGILQGIGGWCYVVLTYSYCHVLHWVPLEYVLLYPLLSLLAGYFFVTLTMSVNAAARTAVHHFFIFPLWFLPAWCSLMLLTQTPFFRSLLFRIVSPALLEPACWIPMLVIAVPAYLLVAWKLFNFNLNRRRPFAVKYCVSLLVYLALTAIFAGIWLGLSFWL